MLGNAMRKYVMSEDKNDYKTPVRSVYNHRIKKYAVQALKDLALLAETLPEDQQEQIFTRDNMWPLIRSVYRVRNKDNYEKEEFERRCRRLLRLSFDALNEICSEDNAWALAPDIMKILTSAGLNETFEIILDVKGIYIKGYSQPST